MTNSTADLRLLRIFTTIVDVGGFAAAQGELNLSLSTISAYVTTLETRLGVRLCKRGRAGFSLTTEGAVVYEEAQRLFASAALFDSRVLGLTQRLTGTLNVGLTDNTIGDPLNPFTAVLTEFADAAPDVTLSIVSRPPHELLRDVAAGNLHIGSAGFPKLIRSLSYLKLYNEVQHFYCARGHPLFDRDPNGIDAGEISKYKVVGRNYWGKRDLKIFSIEAPRAIVSDMEAEARLILTGKFLGYLPEHYAAGFVRAGDLRAVRPDILSYRSEFRAAYDPRLAKIKGSALELFLKILRRKLPRGRQNAPAAASPQ